MGHSIFEWRVPLNTVLNLWIPQRADHSRVILWGVSGSISVQEPDILPEVLIFFSTSRQIQENYFKLCYALPSQLTFHYPNIHSLMALQPFVGPGLFFSFVIFFTQTVGLFWRVISPSQCRYLHTEQDKQNACTQTAMPLVGFEPRIPAFEPAKTVHALARAATVIGILTFNAL
jgi:hypothetical protein